MNKTYYNIDVDHYLYRTKKVIDKHTTTWASLYEIPSWYSFHNKKDIHYINFDPQNEVNAKSYNIFDTNITIYLGKNSKRILSIRYKNNVDHKIILKIIELLISIYPVKENYKIVYDVLKNKPGWRNR